MSKTKQENSVVTTSTQNQTLAGQLQKRQVENTNRKITDYTLLRVIGTGTFGKVYLATLGH
jgi:serine/threonine protein kinase